MTYTCIKCGKLRSSALSTACQCSHSLSASNIFSELKLQLPGHHWVPFGTVYQALAAALLVKMFYILYSIFWTVSLYSSFSTCYSNKKDSIPSKDLGITPLLSQWAHCRTNSRFIKFIEWIPTGKLTHLWVQYQFWNFLYDVWTKMLQLKNLAGKPSTSLRFPHGFMGEFQGIIPMEISS